MMYTFQAPKPSPPPLSKEGKKLITGVIDYYEEKERYQRKVSKDFLIGIIVCLIICLIIFLFANFISESRSTELAKVNSDRVQIEIDNKKDSIERFERKIYTLTEYLEDEEYLLEFGERDTSKSYLDRYSKFSLFQDTNDINKPVIKHKLTKAALAKIKRDSLNKLKEDKKKIQQNRVLVTDSLKKIKKIQKAIRGSIEQLSILIDKKNAKTNIYDFINTTSTRVGAILILIFMVQFLSGIYRYNTKLADFYGARAAALKLYLADDLDFTLDKVIKMISPDNIEIRRTKSPTDQAMDLVEKAISTVNKFK